MRFRFRAHAVDADAVALSLTADDALEAAKIATALQYSFRYSVPVYFDEEGDPIMRAMTNGH